VPLLLQRRINRIPQSCKTSLLRLSAAPPSQMHYILGGVTGRSFVVGYGPNPPLRPHHRAASCPDLSEECGSQYLSTKEPNPHTLYGALVGGPNERDEYSDDRGDFVQNEVACDYNAGFTGALAALLQAPTTAAQCGVNWSVKT
jgi:hypothetical protein